MDRKSKAGLAYTVKKTVFPALHLAPAVATLDWGTSNMSLRLAKKEMML